MAIDDSGDYWRGSAPADIEQYLVACTQSGGSYPVTTFRLVQCPCGSDSFRMARACELTRRTCTACGEVRYILADLEDWEEAAEEPEGVEEFECLRCGSEVVNVGVGFAGYDGRPELDAVKWSQVGLRCIICGSLAYFNDSKVAWGPAAEVYKAV